MSEINLAIRFVFRHETGRLMRKQMGSTYFNPRVDYSSTTTPHVDDVCDHRLRLLFLGLLRSGHRLYVPLLMACGGLCVGIVMTIRKYR